MNYISKKMLVVINKIAVDLSGGTALAGNNIRDGQDLSFVDSIYHNVCFGQKIYNDVYEQAAAYMFFIIKNHVFNDGNKRTGLGSAIFFLERNKIALAPLEEDAVFDFIISVAAGPNDPQEMVPRIADWLRTMALQ